MTEAPPSDELTLKCRTLCPVRAFRLWFIRNLTIVSVLLFEEIENGGKDVKYSELRG